ncbi:unnamed protein product [Rotaria sp. Silwood2]|nr:unnamed protein product [Rotaria sp. Silwood2]
MLSYEPSHSYSKHRNNPRTIRSHLHNHHIRDRTKSVEDFSNARTNILSDAERNQQYKNLTEEEIQQRQLIRQYIFSKLEV